ncbi:MAG: SDR family oxidoreductase [Acidobacteriota bacterium]
MTHRLPQALVIGAAGQVGGALLEALPAGKAAASYRRAVPSGGLFFDLAAAAENPHQATDLLSQVKPTVVFIAAGLTHVDACQQTPQEALAVNRDGPAAVARAASRVGARTVYYSTDYLFDGRSGPYDETAQPAPLSVYGRSKLAGEEAVLKADPEALILRTAVVFGPETQGKNFAYQMARRLRTEASVPIPQDQFSSPTYNRDLAAASLALVKTGAAGIFNVAGPEVMDRAALALRLARSSGLPEDAILPVPTASLPGAAYRPLRCGLVIAKLKAALPAFKPLGVEAAVHHWRTRPMGKSWPGPPSLDRPGLLP